MVIKFALLAILVANAAACGGFFCAPQQPVVQSGEAIIFGVKDRNVTMHVQVNYEGPAEDFSWLLPVMFEPALTTSSEIFFQSMFAQTLPQFTLSIDLENSTTCDLDDNLQFECTNRFPGAVPESAAGGAVDGGVTVKEGSVGPFDFKIIKAVDRDVSAIRNWLSDNGYDEYAGSVPIIDHYVQSDHYFVALRLNKDSDTGDLVPIAIEYQMPDDMETIACIPLILTGVAATETMPIQVYILGDHRADPVNYFRVELDETKVDWMGCLSSPGCFDQDYRARAETAFKAVNDHAFVEEYAGPSNVMNDQIRFDIDHASLAQSASLLDFLNALAAANAPSFGFLDNIFNEYIPIEFNEFDPFSCSLMPSIYNPTNAIQMAECVNSLVVQEYDLAQLAAELKTRVFDPAEDAQAFTDSFRYLTRLWVNMRQEQMVKDPFFSFREDSTLPDRSNIHSAVGIPVCDSSQKITAMVITVDGGDTTTVPATFDCGQWIKTNFDPLYGELDSPALQFVISKFGTEDDKFLLRQANGTFDRLAIEDAFTLMDARVMNQTIQTLLPTSSPVSDPGVQPVFAPPAETQTPELSPVSAPPTETQTREPVTDGVDSTPADTPGPPPTPTLSAVTSSSVYFGTGLSLILSSCLCLAQWLN